jgi:ZIP family zinc transporter
VIEALLFGLIASSALPVGSLIGIRFELPERVLAILLAFASGALMTAMAFELFADSFERSGAWRTGIGFVIGAAVFVAIDSWLDRRVADPSLTDGSAKLDTEAATREPDVSASERGSAAGLALLAAVTLDGVPENLALGVALGEEAGGLVLLLAIFMSNFPEAIVGAASMYKQGLTRRFAVITWSAAALLLAAAVVVGRTLLARSDPDTVSMPLAFAGGAVIASLADTLMPEAYEQGGSTVALATAGGFLVSFLLSTVHI